MPGMTDRGNRGSPSPPVPGFYFSERKVLDMTALRLKDVARCAWYVARTDELPGESSRSFTDAWLLDFWSTSRRLAMHWQRRLAEVLHSEYSSANPSDKSRLEGFACEVLIGDLLVRQMATVVEAAAVARDRTAPAGQCTARAKPIVGQIVQNLEHVRHLMLSQLDTDGIAVSAVDRFRSRCERWTDLLIGPWTVQFGIADYARDPRRAWDFGEEDASETPSPFRQRLLHQSFRAAFRGRLVESPVATTELLTIRQFADDLASIPSSERSASGRRPEPSADVERRSQAARNLLEISLRRLRERDS